jgi:hypothetical protein
MDRGSTLRGRLFEPPFVSSITREVALARFVDLLYFI